MFEPVYLGYTFQDVPTTYIPNNGYGVQAIYNTLNRMKDVINRSIRNWKVRDFAAWIVSRVAPHDKLGEAQAIFDFVQQRVRYCHDPSGLEMLTTPDILIDKIRSGNIPTEDCDGFTILLLSLLKSLGFLVALRAAGYRPDKKFSHVYGLVNIKDRWVPFDAIRKEFSLGMEAPRPTILKDVEV